MTRRTADSSEVGARRVFHGWSANDPRVIIYPAESRQPGVEVPDQGPASVALRESFASIAAQGTRPDAQLLRSHVESFVDAAKAVGWPAERVIVALKEIAQEAGLYPSRHVVLTRSPLSETDRLLVAAVGWCIEHYYVGARDQAVERD